MVSSLSEDTLERFLRPKAVAEAALTNTWGESDAVWVPDGEEGYVLAKPMKDDPGKAELDISGSIIELPDNLKGVERSNPSRNDRTEDMASMAELNEATVLHNLRRRYQSNLIYTYSGLFLVAVNPYKNLPIYTEQIMSMYKDTNPDASGRRSKPPHIFATADEAYRAMLESRRNQSILITGESGAGKTENTKRVIQYLAGIAGKVDGGAGLEERIILANPIMEAFGNAQTVRNNNSSRFGKFIKIDFDQAGGIVGANIERYLLEKSRVTCRSKEERNFHIFYQFLRGASAELKAKFGITGASSVEDYAYTSGTNSFVDGLDDSLEFASTMSAMSSLGFDQEEKESFLKGIAIILLLGNIKLKEDEHNQAQFIDPSQVDALCVQLGCDAEAFGRALLNPVMKAGNELVVQGRDLAQVGQSIEALSRALYERLFTRLVDRINQAIDGSGGTAWNWIGVLDIAGFEIFQQNSFEQLCVNYTNEKLQQFFNHHMFTVEQAEYQKERVDWQMVDFGLDLQPTIDLIERANPIGVLACLDEDCVVPKATDKSYCDKMCGLWKGKSDKFEATRFGDSFAIQHYAGRVEYKTAGWLEKNKDPLNENVVQLLVASRCPLIRSLFMADDSSRVVKRGQFRTVAQKYRESLTLLMQQLASTKPHFVRCIIPNGEKKAGMLKAAMVLDQLRCNGVLEGIRICRMGFPNKVPYGDFCRLYELLATEVLDPDKKLATKQLLGQLSIDQSLFRLGQSKVFFKAGVLTSLDEKRDSKLSAVLRQFQAHCRGALARQSKGRLVRQQEARDLLQRNLSKNLALRQWDWWRLYLRVKPLLNVTRSENRIEELEDEIERVTEQRDQQTAQLRGELDAERDKLMAMETAKREYERQLQALAIQLDESNENKAMLTERLAALESDLVSSKANLSQILEESKAKAVRQEENLKAKEAEYENILASLKTQVNTLKESLDAAEFERLKLERSEASNKGRLVEVEGQLEEHRQAKKELEAKLRQSEDAKRALQDRLDDDALSSAKQVELQAAFDAQLKAAKQRHESDMAVREEEFDAARKRLQREILGLTSELEQERKSSSGLRETIRQYESGTDSLTNKLEAELRNQETWKREKERLENRIKELTKMNQEVGEREDALQGSLFEASNTVRELRQKVGQMEDDAVLQDRAKKQLEARLEKLGQQVDLMGQELAEADTRKTELESKLGETMNKLMEEQDQVAVLRESLRATQHISKVHLHQAEETTKHLEAAQEETKRLDSQIKDLQLRLLESSDSIEVKSMRLGPQTIASLTQLKAQIESESEERLALIRDLRSKDRQIASLSSAQTSLDRDRIILEESLAKAEIKHRKLQTRLEQVERELGEAEFGKRKAERELVGEQEENERLVREMERLKARLATLNSATIV